MKMSGKNGYLPVPPIVVPPVVPPIVPPIVPPVWSMKMSGKFRTKSGVQAKVDAATAEKDAANQPLDPPKPMKLKGLHK
jgi:hypothetical protein